MSCVLHHGDCRELLVTLPDCSVDSVVTDPPYELGFMGKSWDASGIAYSVEMWREVLRVLKPGGHLLAFGGTRTYHRMAVAIEDAGFEIRDSIHWLYGSGFPKSLDVSKAIDKAAGAERTEVGKRTHGQRRADAPSTGSTHGGSPGGYNFASESPITVPATDAARQWEGWGTALKPAHEPIVVARKPLIGTVAANVLQHGTGALNIDGTRIGGDDGRWPANVILDPDAAAELDRQSGVSKSGAPREDRGTGGIWAEGNGVPVGPQYGDTGGASRFFYVAKPSKAERNAGLDGLGKHDAPGVYAGRVDGTLDGKPTAPRQNFHPTLKPLTLMRYLVRLVTPPNGTVLDPFAGSGTTLMAATLEGFNSIGIELTDDYLPIIKGRVAWAENQPKPASNSENHHG